MPEINVLPREIAELIAAGEVVERPASVIKELVENSVDAGADSIAVEIQRGGISYIRITDNGCGISAGDVPKAFLRHATSKIKTRGDLNGISTLGFRGEALAAISSVSRTEMFTKPHGDITGTHCKVEGGEQSLCEEAGCPDGTTIIVRDIFFNTPARMKFLKKDVSDGNAAAGVLERIALSHPEIAFKLIRDGKQTLNTPGDGKTESAVYSVLGREFSGTLIPLDYKADRVEVKGLTCRPVSCRATRNYQYTFLNGRLVRSGTVTAAAEQAYKNSAMVGKFPGFVLYITVPYDTVDVNVHPAKTEVRFSDEKRVFDAVYAAVKNAVAGGDKRPEISLKNPVFNPFERIKTEEYRQQAIEQPTIAERVYPENLGIKKKYAQTPHAAEHRPAYTPPARTYESTLTFKQPLPNAVKSEEPTFAPPPPPPPVRREVSVDIEAEKEKPEIILIGEAFSTYIAVQMGSSIFLIDKHAAHERILYNKLKSEEKIEVQQLLSPVTVVLSREEYDAVINGTDKLLKAGFETEDFGNCAVRVYAIPAALTGGDIAETLSELAESLLKTDKAENEKTDNMLHTVACRAAIKAGNKTSPEEMKALAERVLLNDDIMYCPHGRPVAFEIKRRELERQFGRIQ